MEPETRYVRSGDVHIAYRTFGRGDVNLVVIPTTFSQMEVFWEDSQVRAFLDCLGRFARVAVFDRRGSGLSDPTSAPPMLEDQMDDVRAVMRAANFGTAALLAQIEGTPMAIMFAATFPEHVSALICHTGYARTTWDVDYDWARRPEERDVELLEELERSWGSGRWGSVFAPSRAEDRDFQRWFGKLERHAVSPGTMIRTMRAQAAVDVRALLGQVQAPTLISRRAGDEAFDRRHSLYLAERIPGARLLEVPGRDPLMSFGDVETLVGEFEEFLTGERRRPEPDRALATVLFTDIVGSTERVAKLGDGEWRTLLERHDDQVSRTVRHHGGRLVKTTGDGALATFDGPARALRAAREATDALSGLELPIRAGLHTGEVELRGDDVAGMAVHIGARIAALAGPGEVLASSTVRDLVLGSDLSFEERGERELKGVPGPWRLYALADG